MRTRWTGSGCSCARPNWQRSRLRGLDAKLVDSTRPRDTFYRQRLPYATSEVAAGAGRAGASRGRALDARQYAYTPVLSGSDALTEVRVDASVSGDYRPIVHFINSMERDRMFFLITSINLTGQQTGQVNLRLRVTTYRARRRAKRRRPRPRCRRPAFAEATSDRGTENRKKNITAAGTGRARADPVIVGYNELFGGSSAPPPAPAPRLTGSTNGPASERRADKLARGWGHCRAGDGAGRRAGRGRDEDGEHLQQPGPDAG